MGDGIEKGEKEMVVIDFSKPVMEEPKCSYPGCEKRGIIPMFEDDVIDIKKVTPYCYQHSLIIKKENDQKKIREEILKMHTEGLI